jgi:diadenosine tetraphosphate (Ap4A) HIT family hydrolase
MNLRIWDPENIYSEGFLKEYRHWVVEVSFRQHTLGCFIIFAKRKIEKITELEEDELIELKRVMKDMETTLLNTEEFKPDRFNYLQMGNGLHHLHFHGIPRYASPRTFQGHTWIDETWGHPPKWSKEDTAKDIIMAVKNLMAKKISDVQSHRI